MKNILVKEKITIRDAMKTLNKNAEKCLIVVNEKKKLLGTLTDGDIRKSILNGSNISKNISKVYNRRPSFIRKKLFNKNEAKKFMLQKNISMMPIVNEDNIVIDYFTLFMGFNKKKTLKDISVVIMAGGEGTRLEPFTKILPKPLVPVNDKTIIEHIIDSFNSLGINDFIISLNYKSKIIKAYFEEMNPSYNLTFFREKSPLGTAGSLFLMKEKLKKPFFVSNCDIIIKTNYENFYSFHLEGDYDISLIASTKEYIIPYGTCEINQKGYLSYINEKPKYDFLINTGLYILNPDVINLIPKNKFFHITNLIDVAIKNGKKIGVYPVDDDAWIDIGQWAEYKKALVKL